LPEKLMLTEEARGYLRYGLPEKNLAEALKTGPLTIGEASRRVKNLDIALQWGKKRGWIEIKGGRISLVTPPEEVPEEEALSKIARGESVDESMARTLAERKLVVKQSDLLRKLKELDGKEVTNLTPDLIRTGFWRNVRFRPYNVEVPGKKVYPGKRQPYNEFLSNLRQKLVELGFKEMSGTIIETEFWNYDALYQPQNHPARDWFNTFYIKTTLKGELPRVAGEVRKAHEKGIAGSSGWGYKWDPLKAVRLMPRAHGTALSARTLAKGPEMPGKYFAISRCFRPDVIDAFHGVEFNQVEGIIVDNTLTFKNLLGILEMFSKEVAGAERIRFVPDYYPFTEPSVEMNALHPELGWIEIGGAGIFREELTIPLHVDAPVIAWGLGVDRLAMFKLGINDIRDLFSKDLDWMRQKGLV